MPEKWKRCVEAVKAKQSKWCESRGYPFATDPSGKKCYHPYKICSRLRNYDEPEGPGNRTIYIGPRDGKFFIQDGKRVYMKR